MLSGVGAAHGVSQSLFVVVLLQHGAHGGVGGVLVTCLQCTQNNGKFGVDRGLQCDFHVVVGELDNAVTLVAWYNSPQRRVQGVEVANVVLDIVAGQHSALTFVNFSSTQSVHQRLSVAEHEFAVLLVQQCPRSVSGACLVGVDNLRRSTTAGDDEVVE